MDYVLKLFNEYKAQSFFGSLFSSHHDGHNDYNVHSDKYSDYSDSFVGGHDDRNSHSDDSSSSHDDCHVDIG